MRAILSDPDQDNFIEDNFIEELQESDHEYTPLSEEGKKKVHSQDNVEFFELSIIRDKYDATIVCAALDQKA